MARGTVFVKPDGAAFLDPPRRMRDFAVVAFCCVFLIAPASVLAWSQTQGDAPGLAAPHDGAGAMSLGGLGPLPGARAAPGEILGAARCPGSAPGSVRTGASSPPPFGEPSHSRKMADEPRRPRVAPGWSERMYGSFAYTAIKDDAAYVKCVSVRGHELWLRDTPANALKAELLVQACVHGKPFVVHYINEAGAWDHIAVADY